MPNDATGSPNASAVPSHMDTAQDIVKNTELLFKDSNNKGALDALHKDSQLLNGKLSWKNGELIDNNKPFQDLVKNDLKTLGFPEIQIPESGQIFASKDTNYPTGYRSILASPTAPTQVWDASRSR